MREAEHGAADHDRVGQVHRHLRRLPDPVDDPLAVTPGGCDSGHTQIRTADDEALTVDQRRDGAVADEWVLPQQLAIPDRHAHDVPLRGGHDLSTPPSSVTIGDATKPSSPAVHLTAPVLVSKAVSGP